MVRSSSKFNTLVNKSNLGRSPNYETRPTRVVTKLGDDSSRQLGLETVELVRTQTTVGGSSLASPIGDDSYEF